MLQVLINARYSGSYITSNCYKIVHTVFEFHSGFRDPSHVGFDYNSSGSDAVGKVVIHRRMLTVPAMLRFQTVEGVIETLIEHGLGLVVLQPSRNDFYCVGETSAVHCVIERDSVGAYTEPNPRPSASTQIYLQIDETFIYYYLKEAVNIYLCPKTCVNTTSEYNYRHYLKVNNIKTHENMLNRVGFARSPNITANAKKP